MHLHGLRKHDVATGEVQPFTEVEVCARDLRVGVRCRCTVATFDDGASLRDIGLACPRGCQCGSERLQRISHFVDGREPHLVKGSDAQPSLASFDQEALLLQLAQGGDHRLPGNLERVRQAVLRDVLFRAERAGADRVEHTIVDLLDQGL